MSNAGEIVEGMTELAAALNGGPPSDFDERKERLLALLAEYGRDVRPLLPYLGDVEGEERTRRVYGDMELKLPKALNFTPVMVIDIFGPDPDWELEYRPMRHGVVELIQPLEGIRRWARLTGDAAGEGE